MPVITISRQMCSFGDEIAEALGRRLGWDVITRAELFSRFPKIAPSTYDKNTLSESAKHWLKSSGTGGTFLDSLKRELSDFTKTSSAVLVGFGAQVLFASRKEALHVRIVADRDVRLARAVRKLHISEEEASRVLETADRKHRKFVAAVFGADLSDQALYHLTLNTSMLTVEECVASILALYAASALKRELGQQTAQSELLDRLTEKPMKNQSEAEFAKILDMYQIDWLYEPKTFPVEWDAEGNVTMAFCPDFYLTKFDTYIELTTMDQRYVTEKNKKVRKLRELYPGTNIKIVYRKDFHALVERFNLGGSAS